MIWQDFEEAAPELARHGRERFDETGLALLGTVSKAGWPRISPVEPYFVGGHLLLGLMARSAKARDVRQDPRCVLHSAISNPDGSQGEFKLYGRAREVRDSQIGSGVPKAWWTERPPEDAFVVSVEVERARFVAWDTAASEMIVTRWSAERGLSESRVGYP